MEAVYVQNERPQAEERERATTIIYKKIAFSTDVQGVEIVGG